MHVLCWRRLLAATSVAGHAPIRALQHQYRRCAALPTEDEVIRAYNVLGVSTSCGYDAIKKKFLQLAKEHHPDVAGSGSTSSRMVDINNAYNTVSRFHKAGRSLSSSTQRTGGGSSSHSGGSNTSTAAGSRYQPWHEDLDPLLHEMMWEEMRRQHNEETFARSMFAEGFNAESGEPHGGPSGFRGGRSHRNEYGGGQSDRGSARSKQHQQQSPPRQAKKSTTWPDADLQAMVNMYQDGKSFEFIANALGKDTKQVTEEFNRWSADSKGGRHGAASGRSGRPRRRWRDNVPPGPFYYTESPDDIPLEYYEMMAEMNGDPYGYCVEDDLEGDPTYDSPNDYIPYKGGHVMNGGRPENGGGSATHFSPKRPPSGRGRGHKRNNRGRGG